MMEELDKHSTMGDTKVRDRGGGGGGVWQRERQGEREK